MFIKCILLDDFFLNENEQPRENGHVIVNTDKIRRIMFYSEETARIVLSDQDFFTVKLEGEIQEFIGRLK